MRQVIFCDSSCRQLFRNTKELKKTLPRTLLHQSKVVCYKSVSRNKNHFNIAQWFIWRCWRGYMAAKWTIFPTPEVDVTAVPDLSSMQCYLHFFTIHHLQSTRVTFCKSLALCKSWKRSISSVAHSHFSPRIERCFYQISLKIKESSWQNILQINVDLKEETTWFLYV